MKPFFLLLCFYFSTQLSMAQVFHDNPKMEYINGKFDTLYAHSSSGEDVGRYLKNAKLHGKYLRFCKSLKGKSYGEVEGIYYRRITAFFEKDKNRGALHQYVEAWKDQEGQVDADVYQVNDTTDLYRAKIEIDVLIKCSNLLVTFYDNSTLRYKKGALVRYSSQFDPKLKAHLYYILSEKSYREILFLASWLKENKGKDRQ